MKDSPSLREVFPEAVDRAYGTGVIMASAETGVPESTFPANCPWTYEQLMDPDFWPAGRPISLRTEPQEK